ncbi:predicted protein [Plenodomus lingam JN3]|uniref:Predicted protein n=1 Tax=Leptosphaeria maculans (strain JN3 / isolate v23.1.3 / race Av1-4-5-6-7-8) TaxID=985895 RepID=E5A4U3_LEPMJ|nr:predicted protein [Plenodomus lingam JN3]CBX98641.1 predicted protein [Plenodomus lingam JN3]
MQACQISERHGFVVVGVGDFLLWVLDWIAFERIEWYHGRYSRYDRCSSDRRQTGYAM